MSILSSPVPAASARFEFLRSLTKVSILSFNSVSSQEVSKIFPFLEHP